MLPVSLDLKNFFSHKDSFIDFSLFESALLIGNTEGNYDISNGCGKSAIFEGILWCLFNKSRAASMDDVIFWGESGCKVTFIFKHSNELYRVIRKRYRSGNTSYVEFAKQDSSGAWIDVSGSTPSLTNDEIIKTIKFDYKTFINSAYFRQNDISEFTETDASRKKEILKSIIDISKWDAYEDQIRASLKELKAESKIIESKIEGFDQIFKDYTESSVELDNCNNSLKVKVESRAELSLLLEGLTNKYQEMKSKIDTSSWDKTVEALGQLEKQKKFSSEKLEAANKSNSDYLNLIRDKKTFIQEINKKVESLIIDEEVEEKINTSNRELIELKAGLATSKELIKSLNNRVITKDNCYICHQSISEDLYHKLHSDHNDEISQHNKNIIYYQNKIKELESKIENLEKVRENKKKKDAASNKVNSIGTELRILEERSKELATEIEKYKKDIIEIEANIKINNEALDSLRDDSFKALQNSIHNNKSDLADLNSDIEKINHNIGILTEKTSSLLARINEKQEFKNTYIEKQKRVTILEKMVRLLGKNGIQTILLNAIIEDLEKTANEILKSICNEPFHIFLDTQRLGSDGISVVDTLDLRVKKEGIVQNFKSLSGGEQFRISLALRIALSEISSRHGGSALEFLLLDEINSPLDRQGTESLFINVIKSLEKKYKILVITHNDALKEKFTDVLDITKVNSESSVSYISI